MSDCVAWTRGRAFPRLALAGLGLALLSGCSSDVTRFSASPSPFSDNPFSNPFASKTADAAPTPGVTDAPLAQGAPAAAATHTASLSKPQAVGGSAVGWTAAGGSPIVVADGETLDSLSGRYGVPAAALLAANGLSSGSEVKSGMRIVVPVYHADGHGVASAETEKAARSATGTSPTLTRPRPKKDEGKRERPRQGRQGRQRRRSLRRRTKPRRRGRRGRAGQVGGDQRRRRSTRRRPATSNPARRRPKSR